MKAEYKDLVLMLTTVTGLEVVPQGQEVAEASAYITYLGIPGGLTERAYDGNGLYIEVYQIDIWARASDLYPDPEEATFSVSAQILEHVKPLFRFNIRQMPAYIAPSEDAQGYARATLKLLVEHEF